MLLIGVAFFHLGPDLHFGVRQRILSTIKLADGSRLFLTINPNRDIIEAYTVHLHRVYSSGAGSRCLVGFEESYWWFTTMAQKSNGIVNIGAFGRALCTYDPISGILQWNDKSLPPQPSQDDNGWTPGLSGPRTALGK